MKYKYYDMFAGIGGFRLALDELGFECVGGCEINKYARETYKKNFGELPTEEDATKIDPKLLRKFQILCAGFPCQPFSYAGQRRGFEDTRGTLFFEIIRIAKETRPEIILLENVKGLLNHDESRTFTKILNTLYELGYDPEWQVFNSQYWVPQERERVFIIGHSREKPTRKIFPIREEVNWNDKPFKETQNERKQFFNSSTLSTRYRSTDSYICYGNRVREFTIKEREQLQGFPIGWTEGISEVQRTKVLGNAVPPPMVKFIASHFVNL